MPQTSIADWLTKPTSHVADANVHTESVCTASTPFPRGLQQLPPNITLEAVTAATLRPFRRLNSLLLPIPYSAKFYDEILSDPITSGITLAARWRDSTETSVLIGGIRCRLLTADHPTVAAAASSTAPEKPVLYVATIATLSPYRSAGVGSHLLATVTARAIERHGVGTVVAHVWEANPEGLEWYAKRGFTVVTREEDYYRRLTPGTAVVVRKEVGPGDLLAMMASNGRQNGTAG